MLRRTDGRYSVVLVAQAKGVDPNDLAEAAADNARRIFDF